MDGPLSNWIIKPYAAADKIAASTSVTRLELKARTLKTLFSKKFQSESMFFLPMVKFIYSEKATKFCEILTLLLTVCTVVKSKVEISQNFVLFSEYMNFTMGKKKHGLGLKLFAEQGLQCPGV